jgi:hypothetical protein
MEEPKIIKGTPPAVFLPAKNYVFQILSDHYVIEIPRKGNYHDLAPDFFPEGSGEFDILNEQGTLFMPSITKVLFASKKYPDLDFNQLFVPHTLEFKEETVTVIGQVIGLVIDKDNLPEEDNVEEPDKNEDEGE